MNGRKTRQVQKEKESDADTAAYYVTTFAYDSRDMLVEEKYQRWDSGNSAWDNMYWARYQYDTAGNMVGREVNQIVNGNSKWFKDYGFAYSRGYQLTEFIRENAVETRTFTLTYDANGNMTHISQSATFTDTFYNITEMEFQFDEKNRMTHYRFGGAGSYYQIKYDALGRVRERVDLNPTTTKYYSDGRQLIQQLDNSDNVDFDYFRGPTGLMRQVDVDASNKKRFYIKDPLGTVLAMVNPSDLSVEHYNYNAWGEHLDKDDTDFPTDTNFMRYIGCRVEAFGDSTAQTDAIYHLDHRHYLPVIGRFLQRDPLVNRPVYPANHVNPYGYAANNPVNYSDESGLFWLPLVAIIAVAVLLSGCSTEESTGKGLCCNRTVVVDTNENVQLKYPRKLGYDCYYDCTEYKYTWICDDYDLPCTISEHCTQPEGLGDEYPMIKNLEGGDSEWDKCFSNIRYTRNQFFALPHGDPHNYVITHYEYRCTLKGGCPREKCAVYPGESFYACFNFQCVCPVGGMQKPGN